MLVLYGVPLQGAATWVLLAVRCVQFGACMLVALKVLLQVLPGGDACKARCCCQSGVCALEGAVQLACWRCCEEGELVLPRRRMRLACFCPIAYSQPCSQLATYPSDLASQAARQLRDKEEACRAWRKFITHVVIFFG